MNENIESVSLQKKEHSYVSLVYDLYIDILGSLVPGLFIVILGGALIFLSIATIYYAIYDKAIYNDGLLVAISDILYVLHWEFATIIIVGSYIIGTVFFRQDIKRPDSLSALYVWMHAKKKERKGLAVQEKRDVNKNILKLENDDDKISHYEKIMAIFFSSRYIKILGLDTQFPYSHIKCYLLDRGLNHLVDLIPWCPNDKKTEHYRTKMFINIIKIRLLTYFPELSRAIIRNEAHVRLASSVWYVSSALLYLSLFVISVLILICSQVEKILTYKIYYNSMVLAIIILVFCFFMKIHLQKCIHYMRVREVVYVLEGAYLAQKKEEELFSDLISKKPENSCNNKTDCVRNKK
jgi:hypothetical protein